MENQNDYLKGNKITKLTNQTNSQYSKIIDYKTLYYFLKSVKGEFKNACYVVNTCSGCADKRCSDLLMAVSSKGTPIFIFYDLATKYSDENIQFDEFSGFLTLNDFENLYGVWMRNNITDHNLCPAKYFKQLLKENAGYERGDL